MFSIKFDKILEITFIVLAVIGIRVLNVESIQIFYSQVVPRGDPFTYVSNWMAVISNSKIIVNVDSSKGILYVIFDYLKEVLNVFMDPTSWYTFHTLLSTILSPILTVDPISVTILNFSALLITCLVIYFSLNNITNIKYFSITSVLLYLMMPWHHNYSAVSLWLVQLDTIYLNILFAVAFLFLGLFKSNSLIIQIFLGVFMGLAVWTRANAPMALGILGISFILAYLISNDKPHRSLFKILIVPSVIFIWMAYFYYQRFYQTVLNYYAPLRELSSVEKTPSPELIIMVLSTVPGKFLFGETPNTNLIFISSIFSHFFILLAIVFIALRFRSSALKYIHSFVLFGVLIYVITLVLQIFVFNSPNVFYYQPYSPILIGLFIVFAGFVRLSFSQIEFQKSLSFVPVSMLFFTVLVISLFVTTLSWSLPKTQSGDDAIFIRKLSNNPSEFIGPGRTAFLWYATYNTPILNYYRRIEGKDLITFNDSQAKFSFYSNEFWSDLWIPTSEPNFANIQKGLELTLNEADNILVPENFSCYQTADPYPLYLNNKILFRLLYARPRDLYLNGYLKDSGCKILILSRFKSTTNLLSHPNIDAICEYCRKD
jgi:hypothetical protein